MEYPGVALQKWLYLLHLICLSPSWFTLYVLVYFLLTYYSQASGSVKVLVDGGQHRSPRQLHVLHCG